MSQPRGAVRCLWASHCAGVALFWEWRKLALPPWENRKMKEQLVGIVLLQVTEARIQAREGELPLA